MYVIRRLFSLFLLVTAPASMAVEVTDIPYRYDRYYVDYFVNEDGSHTEAVQLTTTVLKERAIERLKDYSITYSTSVEKVEIVESYTRKADGRRIDVPKDNFQVETNTGRNKDAPVFSDQTTLTIVFPEVAVGDSVILAYKRSQVEPIFPGKFSFGGWFSRAYEYDDVRVRLDLPASLWMQYKSREMAEQVAERDGRKLIEWSFTNKQPIHSKRRNYSVYDLDQDPGFTISNYRNYAEIAEAYGVRARPKAVVSERVQKLADEVAAGKTTPREQAKALYDWVATQITYAGNCIGVGAVVPHDIDFILDNRMGDCKDHATLLQALLAAKGIKSIQALVNARSVYRLPSIPSVATVNHVINYVPEFDLYLDSTAATIPFGMLPFAVADKPVLWVDGFREGTRTPAQPVGEARQVMKTVAKLSEDGTITGTTEISLNGIFAANTRAWMRNLPKEKEEEIIATAFERQGHIGSGTMERPDAQALLGSYHYKINFKMEHYAQRPGAGAFFLYPLVFSEAAIGRLVQSSVEPLEEVDIACSNGYSAEEYTIELPKGLKVLSLPDNMSVANESLSYKATYKLKGRTLTVKRIFDDRTVGHVCSPAVSARFKEAATKVMTDLRSQVLYK